MHAEEWAHDIALLKCTSSYPAPIDEANMKWLKILLKNLMSLRGSIIQWEHCTNCCNLFWSKNYRKALYSRPIHWGPDASFSMNESEFTQMVAEIRDAEKAIGTIDYSLTKNKKGRDFSRSLYVVEDVKSGDIITINNVRSIRPGFGLHPKYYHEVLGKKFNKSFSKGTRLSLDMISTN